MGSKTKTIEPRIDLTKYMVNEDLPNGKRDADWSYGWCAGSQLEALRFYLSKKVKILASYQDDFYSGDVYAVLKVGRTYVLWRDSFGSCSGCDGLEGENGYEYIKDTLQEGNTRQFASLNDAEEYIKILHEDSMWDRIPSDIIDQARKWKQT